MADQDDMNTRLRRLRESTEALQPPARMVPRILATVEMRAARTTWIDAIVASARWTFVPAALASATLAAVMLLGGPEIDDILLLVSSVGGLP